MLNLIQLNYQTFYPQKPFLLIDLQILKILPQLFNFLLSNKNIRTTNMGLARVSAKIKTGIKMKSLIK